MFYTKERIENIWRELREVAKQISKINDELRNRMITVPCDICKCRIAKEDAIKGKSVVVERECTPENVIKDYFAGFRAEAPQKIHTPYYCLRCKKK